MLIWRIIGGSVGISSIPNAGSIGGRLYKTSENGSSALSVKMTVENGVFRTFRENSRLATI